MTEVVRGMWLGVPTMSVVMDMKASMVAVVVVSSELCD
jgi:hypothetical protein